MSMPLSRLVSLYCVTFASYLHCEPEKRATVILPITSPNVFSGRVLSGSLLHSVLEHGNFFNIDISQGSVATCLRCGGYVIITLLQIY